jgi:hypothetical protein
MTLYRAVTGPDMAFHGESSTIPAQIRGGLNRTIPLMETADAPIPRLQPGDLDVMAQRTSDWASLHRGRGPIVRFFDGAVGQLPGAVSPAVIRAMATVKG